MIDHDDLERLRVAASRKLEQRTVARVASHLTGAAVKAIAGLHYLADLDDEIFLSPAADAKGYPKHAVHSAHTRWAAASAVSAIDICAGLLARIHQLYNPPHEADLRKFDPGNAKKPKQGLSPADRVASLRPHWRVWVEAVHNDPRYLSMLKARNELTHASAPERVIGGAAGHANRYACRFGGRLDATAASLSAIPWTESRTLVVDARDLATQHVQAFLHVAIMHE